MVSRKRAIGEFLLSVAALSLQLYSRRSLKTHEEYDDPPKLSTRPVVVGVLYHIGYHSAYDHDCGQIRTDKRRALAFGVCSALLQRRVFSEHDSQYGLSFGMLVGTILYRLWYGVLRSVPISER